MSLSNFEKLKQRFDSFSHDINRKQKLLSARHKAMSANHTQFKNRINKRMNSYSK